MIKIYLIQWSATSDYYNGKGFFEWKKGVTKEYDSEESAMPDLKELTRIYYKQAILLTTAFVNTTKTN